VIEIDEAVRGCEGGKPISYRSLWKFFGPLAASDLMMTAVHPVVISGLTRHSTSELGLAAYGTIVSLIGFLESPIIFIMHSANALVRDSESYRMVRKYSLLLALITCVPIVGLVHTRWGVEFLKQVVGLSSILATTVVDALKVFVLWPVLVGWRRFCQGVLISLGRTVPIGWGTVVRLATVAAAAFLTDILEADSGSVRAAAFVLVGTMALEALFVSVWLIWALQKNALPQSDGDRQLTFSSIIRFYAPLLLTTVLIVTTRPMIVAGLARAPSPETAIAAWSVVYSLTLLFSNHTRVILQMVIALAQDAVSFQKIGRFGRAIGLLSTLGLMVLGLTPFGTWVLDSVLHIEGSLQAVIRLGLALTSFVPLLRVLQNEARGVLISMQATRYVNLAAITHVATLVSIPFLIGVFDLAGVPTAAGMFAGAYLVEVLVLHWMTHQHLAPRLMEREIDSGGR
jgi:hypothetical protein